jgi:threonine dehydrogenase-like Zn-dependent dehydrogenase
MKSMAVVFPRRNEAELAEVEVPDALGPTDVLVRTVCSGLSTGTERWLLTGQFYRSGTPGASRRSFPLVPGYQKVGFVERVGSEVVAFRPGARVFCTRGRITRGARAHGAAPASGGHLAWSVQDQAEVISVPPEIDDLSAAGLVLAQVGWNGGSRPPVAHQELVVVVGDGLVGQYAAQRLRGRGARVLLVGRHAFRLGYARRFSADEVSDVPIERLGDLLDQLTPRQRAAAAPTAGQAWLTSEEARLVDLMAEPDARGASVIVDTTGRRDTVRLASGLLRHNGHLVLLGWYPEPHNEMLEDWLHRHEIAMYGTGGWRRPRLLATLEAIRAGEIRVAPLVTHRVGVADAPRIYRDLVLQRQEEFLGVVFDWPQPADIWHGASA